MNWVKSSFVSLKKLCGTARIVPTIPALTTVLRIQDTSRETAYALQLCQAPSRT